MRFTPFGVSAVISVGSLLGIVIAGMGGFGLLNPEGTLPGAAFLAGAWAMSCAIADAVIAAVWARSRSDRMAAIAFGAFAFLLGALLLLASFGLCGFQTDPFTCHYGD